MSNSATRLNFRPPVTKSSPTPMNTTIDAPRGQKFHLITRAAVLTSLLLGTTARVQAANDTWSGSGQDRFWKTPANWLGNLAPSAGDSLFFGGTSHTSTT